MTTSLKLLSLMDENGVAIDKLSSETGLSTRTVKRYLRELEEKGLVEQRGELYALTAAGLKLKKSLQALRARREAPPYIVTDPSSGAQIPLSFRNYKQLLAIIDAGLADKSVLEEHMRKYLATWVKDSLGDEYLAYLLETGAIKNLDDLKNYLETILKALGDQA
ncbi:winged helix-turn-helix domain-containing protein [Desulfurococcus mucosus]|uniref:Regulatory protein, MarR n=1 Tax=Desulfurococcus mucosus (strain ATCC 35584 / DSM 2162 / JCM 9187 / O7/1) TaxID=765177 RepID=E8R983_DESM0|nr:winged helix-turn-helix domain-containing protein [Desulfurococcus mucosus]ADV65059.1 regulatory protein, MarR [Desulfurococcus mucosus DSM 2162]